MAKRKITMYGVGVYQCGCGGIDEYSLTLDKSEAEAKEKSAWDSISDYDDPENEWSSEVRAFELEEIAKIHYQGRQFVVFRIPGSETQLGLHTEYLEIIPDRDGSAGEQWKRVTYSDLRNTLQALIEES